ncbi:pilus assembly protein [Kitasatospora sp. RB6PN24]|uniref:TadE/TadG family type IV pilus assembly protein n=1 Tax=Kitasatospora humi TaxID=2893891 RepID=UPI001E3B7191|nr:TadE/TadG family type IV pilus assembly protein [Kitasatospora humi]MCC9309958.1 pilus assembly protein [Kitasatospora humi]
MPRLLQRLRQRLSGDRGSSTVEFLVITPLLLLIILTLVQFAMYYFATQVTQAAAQAGARKARETADANPGSWQGLATQTASNRISSLGPQLVNGSAQINPVHDGDQVGLTITAQVVPVVPFLHLHVTSRSVGPIERFIPDVG